MRGKLEQINTAVAVKRITPAGAGKTLIFVSRDIDERDHPRRCGENSEGLEILLIFPGSPPQVRGKHVK